MGNQEDLSREEKHASVTINHFKHYFESVALVKLSVSPIITINSQFSLKRPYIQYKTSYFPELFFYRWDL